MREFELLDHVFTANSGLPGSVVIPPGDDMGMIRVGGCGLLLGVDQVVAGIHFDPTVTSPELIGCKAVNRSLSDVAAMATVPVGAVATVVLSPEFSEESAAVMFDAMRKASELHQCPLIGGDVAIHTQPDAPMVCTVTILSRPIDEAHPPVRRSGARAGDGVFVTGHLGGSLVSGGGGRHLMFGPRIKEAIELYRALGSRLRAMIDISDGLGRDAGHIAMQSGVRLQIEADLIPCTDGCNWAAALCDGEDYELLFTAEGAVPEQLCGTPVTRIGSVTDPADSKPGSVVRTPAGEMVDAMESGWQHQS